MNKEIFFHVGLSKTASTYLQNKFFNKLRGINYIGNHNYKNYKKIIDSSDEKKILVSREFDRQFNEQLQKFAKYYPQAKIIMVLRRQDSWIASQYRRFVKNGGTKDFKYFFDVKNDNGLWKLKEAYFFDKIKFVEKLFKNKPLILLHKELKTNPFVFFDRIAEYTNTDYDKNRISLKFKHKSYSEKQLKFLKKTCKIFKRDFRHKNRVLSKLRWFLCHLFLYFALILPEFLFSKEPLINPEELKQVREYFAEDWKKCKNYF